MSEGSRKRLEILRAFYLPDYIRYKAVAFSNTKYNDPFVGLPVWFDDMERLLPFYVIKQTSNYKLHRK